MAIAAKWNDYWHSQTGLSRRVGSNRGVVAPITRDLADMVANGALIRIGERCHARYQVRISLGSVGLAIIVRKEIQCFAYLSVSLCRGPDLTPAAHGGDGLLFVKMSSMLSASGTSTVL